MVAWSAELPKTIPEASKVVRSLTGKCEICDVALYFEKWLHSSLLNSKMCVVSPPVVRCLCSPQ